MSIYQDKAKECKCCGKHVPLPTVMREFNDITLCPTTFANVMEYTRLYNATGSRPPGSVRKHFSEYVQQIVEESIRNTSE